MMNNAVEPQSQFHFLTKAEVLAALDDPDRTNPIAQEVARLMEAYNADLQLEVRRLGHIPSIVLETKRRWPIEAIALQLAADTLHQTFHKEMAAVIQDIVNLCETGEFNPVIFLDFIRSRKTRSLMQYHRDYFQKPGSRH